MKKAKDIAESSQHRNKKQDISAKDEDLLMKTEDLLKTYIRVGLLNYYLLAHFLAQ